MAFIKITEQDSKYNALEKKSVFELLTLINTEDQSVAKAVQGVIPEISILTECIVEKLKNNGRLFYIGAGTSGRLGILDASELPPTFGVAKDKVIGIIAGGDKAIRNAVEFAEDSIKQGFNDLESYNINTKDVVIGIAASGTTPYVVHALAKCSEHDITTACITSNRNSPLSKVSKYPIEVVVGPEFITGSSRMKAGTAQKLILNMISTTVMIQLGHIKDNKMIDMQLSNTKLVNRAIEIITNSLNISELEAKELLNKHKSVRASILNYKNGTKS